jgi:hypothetical protein
VWVAFAITAREKFDQAHRGGDGDGRIFHVSYVDRPQRL